MSDNRHIAVENLVGTIEHTGVLSDDIGALFENVDYSDLTLIVGNQRFPVHRVILAARSDYFRALLFGGLKESLPDCQQIELRDTSPVAFRHLLKYVYTGCTNLIEMKEDVLLDMLGLAHQYGFVQLQEAVSDFLKATLNVNNACLIYDIASLYSLISLRQTCTDFIDKNAQDVINTDSFCSLSQSALADLIARDSFYAPEIEIFGAVVRWVGRLLEQGDTSSSPDAVLRHIRLPLISLSELLNVVRPTELLSADRILDAIKVSEEKKQHELAHRGFFQPGVNWALGKHDAHVVRGENGQFLLDGDQGFDLERGFARHLIDDQQLGIVIRLRRPTILNTLRLHLWDRDTRSYSYYVEVSVDDQDYVRIVDYRDFLCRSRQEIRFPDCVVRFIKVVGTHNTVNKWFHLVSIEALYSVEDLYIMRDGLLVPKFNVASIEASAFVMEGVSRSRNALINGNTTEYDWDSGYTCHQLGSGAIVVQLAQPFMIGSMRLLLWDCDDRTYSYVIQVSTDNVNWEMVADRRNAACRGWQTLVFPARPTVFIKITGTHNTANEVFHCVHFECPASLEALAGLEQDSDAPDGAPSPAEERDEERKLLPMGPHPQPQPSFVHLLDHHDFQHHGQQQAVGLLPQHSASLQGLPSSASSSSA